MRVEKGDAGPGPRLHGGDVSSEERRVSESAVRRLSLDLRALEELRNEGELTVSSGALASRSGTTAAQVRKDLSLFGSFGKRGLGYPVDPLVRELREILGLDRRWRVILVGAGRIGSALFEYPHFRERGFEIVAIVDDDPAKVGRRWRGIRIRPACELADAVARERVDLAILTVPASAAQRLAEALVAAGVRGILNFAPVQLRLPSEVAVQGVNMAVELESLSFALRAASPPTLPDLCTGTG